MGEGAVYRPGAAERRIFVMSQVPYMALALIDLAWDRAVTGESWPLVVFVVSGLAFIGPLGMGILCRHCPFYAGGGQRLHCIAPNPFPKIWRYSPHPLSGPERWLVMLISAFLLAFPGAVHARSILVMASQGGPILTALALEAATVLAAFLLFASLRCLFCTSCPNQSCPFNRRRDYIREGPELVGEDNGQCLQ